MSEPPVVASRVYNPDRLVFEQGELARLLGLNLAHSNVGVLYAEHLAGDRAGGGREEERERGRRKRGRRRRRRREKER